MRHMAKIGMALSSEEHGAPTLVKLAKKAEDSGFSFVSISDHFHPWIDSQGNSPFVWTVLGGISQVTKSIQVMTGVTSTIIRIHPVILAQAAATVAQLLPGRFLFGVGTGENLNEHIVGQGWPAIEVRRMMFEESIEVIRLLWEGGMKSFYGSFYTVEKARIYSLPPTLPPILISGLGKVSAAMAGKIGDGFVCTKPDKSLVKAFEKAGGKSKPKYGQITVCYASTEEEAKRIAFRYWPISAMGGEAHQELRIPAHFEQLAQAATPDMVAKQIVCGPEKHRHVDAIQQMIDAGFDHVYIHQVGPDQESFLKFYEKNILPEFAGE